MKKILFLTPPDAKYGFSLTGLSQRIVQAGEIEAALMEAFSGPEHGLVVVDERLIADIAEERLREMERNWHGVLLALPSPEVAPPEAEDYAARLIRRAIGYHVRLNV